MQWRQTKACHGGKVKPLRHARCGMNPAQRCPSMQYGSTDVPLDPRRIHQQVSASLAAGRQPLNFPIPLWPAQGAEVWLWPGTAPTPPGPSWPECPTNRCLSVQQTGLRAAPALAAGSGSSQTVNAPHASEGPRCTACRGSYGHGFGALGHAAGLKLAAHRWMPQRPGEKHWDGACGPRG